MPRSSKGNSQSSEQRVASNRRRIGLIAAGAAFVLILVTVAVSVLRFRSTETATLEADEKSPVLASGSSTQIGWHGWPPDAPPPAIAPFDAKQARQFQESWAKYLGVPVEYTNSIGMKFVLIPPGEFTMGCTKEEIEKAELDATAFGVVNPDNHWRYSIRCEGPSHHAVLTRPYFLGVTEVTQRQFEAVIGSHTSHYSSAGNGHAVVTGLDTSEHPVDSITWDKAVTFSVELSRSEGLKPFYFQNSSTTTYILGDGYRLPTSAEWEFACRAGSLTRYFNGDSESSVLKVGWFQTNSGARSHSVAELPANPFGLFDIHGNAYEWTQDEWTPDFYEQFRTTSAVDPITEFTTEPRRVLRGGHSGVPPFEGRSGSRTSHFHDWGYGQHGMRLALSVDGVKSRPHK